VAPSAPTHTDLRVRREVTLWAAGAGLEVGGVLLRGSGDRVVPLEGLEAAGIQWSTDRGMVGNHSLDANATSDWTRNVALAFPFALSLVTGSSGDRWSSAGRRSLVYAETIVIVHGLTQVGKATIDRARPFAYLPPQDRPEDVSYDVSLERTFRSMPSGHAAGAWAAAAMGVTDHLLVRPEAGWAERVAVGLLGGALAGSTSALRVQAGQHFPSDVIVGAALGVTTGVGVPLMHRGRRSLPSSRATLQSSAGVVAGTLLGVLFARTY
jgi:membrane-associated phospholipid phosphatase